VPPLPERIAEAERMVRLQIGSRDVRAPRVLDALARVPRHLFVPSAARSFAYQDSAMPIGHGQTISQPYMVAVMTEALGLGGGERVLEVGTGSGYQTAVLALLCADVFSVERISALAAGAARVLADLGIVNVTLRVGDGSDGWPEHAPYEAILVTAAAPSLPQSLCAQLADNGVLVVPVGDVRGTQELVVARRRGASFVFEGGMGCRFVPLYGRSGFPEPDR
jgi:protein-L-isoaspartate(D-aspartate) O-methyltransferase